MDSGNFTKFNLYVPVLLYENYSHFIPILNL